MVGVTGIEPVTPTMSKYWSRVPSNVRCEVASASFSGLGSAQKACVAALAARNPFGERLRGLATPKTCSDAYRAMWRPTGAPKSWR